MIVESDGYRFDFTDAIDAFKFDETSTVSQHFHGGFMKAVDVIAEFSNAYVFVELKEFTNLVDTIFLPLQGQKVRLTISER